MKTLGDIRPVDRLGRVTIPKDIRNRFKLEPGTKVGVYADEKWVFLKSVKEECVLCGNEENLVAFEDKKICANCIEKLKK